METDVEKYLVELVEAHDGVCLKWVSPGRVGVPDRIVLLPEETTLFVETKAENGVLKSWQTRCHVMLQELGFVVDTLWTKQEVDHWADIYLHSYAPRFTCKCGKIR